MKILNISINLEFMKILRYLASISLSSFPYLVSYYSHPCSL